MMTTHITNLGNSISNLFIESSIKSFIARHETYEGRKVSKDEIKIVSVFPMTNAESTYYRVKWELC